MLVEAHYSDPDAKTMLVDTFTSVLNNIPEEPIFLCVGSDRHILDCFGPLVGTMLSNRVPELHIYGTLQKPLHAINIIGCMKTIRQAYPQRFEVAIDASLGSIDQMGFIKVRDGSLLPGRALAKRLPPVGHISIIGVVGERLHRQKLTSLNKGSLAHVYDMAKVVCDAIEEWYRIRSIT